MVTRGWKIHEISKMRWFGYVMKRSEEQLIRKINIDVAG